MINRYVVFLFLCLLSQISLAQAVFEYDAAGNRVKRTVTPYPDLTPVMSVSPSTTYGTAALVVKLYVVELNGTPTNGLITVKITKEASIAYSFNPTATSVGGTAVQNANWSFDATSETGYYVLTSKTVVAGGDASTIGLTGTLTPNGSGQSTVSMVIAGGGEIKLTNNVATTKINYFP